MCSVFQSVKDRTLKQIEAGQRGQYKTGTTQRERQEIQLIVAWFCIVSAKLQRKIFCDLAVLIFLP